MSDLETRLTAALHADVAPARDAVFRVEVLVRLEQARFRRQVRRTVAAAVLLAVLAAVSAPAIDAWITAAGQRLWFVALTAAAALCVLSVAMIVPGFRRVAKAVGRLLYP
jgi:peptidoglycan/LPS O-acetylase OafA/YrhL